MRIHAAKLKTVAMLGFGTLMLMLLPAVCPAQTPQFHRDCDAGMLLANGSCQPIEVVLAAQGGRVFWVSQANGNDGNLGMRTQPWKTISRAAQEMLPGDAVIVRAGVYREEIIPLRGGSAINRRISYAAYTGEDVVVSGADVVSNWTQSGNAWRTSWTVSLCATEATDGNIFRREMVIADGKLLRAVYTRAEVVPGTFFVEGTSCAPTAIYMRLPGDVAPTGHLLEAATRSQLFSPEPGDGWFRLIGFTFRHAANAAREPSVRPGSQGSLIEENTVEWTNGFGMATSGTNNVFRGNKVNDNGQLGIGGSCSSCLVEYNQTNRNNWKHFNVSFEAGAMKFSRTSNTTLRYHEAGDNYGNGIWFDGFNTDNVIEQSIAYRNLQSNIFLEAHTSGTIVRNNVSFGATVYVTPTYTVGGAGMILYRSPNNTIVNNTFFGNERIGLWIENNRTGEWLANGAEGYNKIYNNVFVKNGTEIRFDAENQTDARTTKFDGNLYWHPTTGTLFRLNYPGVTTYSGNDPQRWQQLLNSDFQARVADPLLENLTSSSGWHLTAGSPARVMGVAPPAPVPNDHEGDLRPASNADVGADEYSLSQTNSPPTVSLTAPSDGQSFSAPANVVLTAAASDSDGTVSKVQFYNGTTLLGTATTSPYQFTWSNVPAGNYTLTAKATDNTGASRLSTAATIVVNGTTTIPAVEIYMTSIVDGSEGVILNSGSFNYRTFDVITSVNLGDDKRTRLMIFATNVSSNAPNTDPTNDIQTVAGTILNVAESVIVEARTTDGRTLRLPVEYAGTLGGLAEIDQVNVMLLSELQGAGNVELTIKIGAYSSNTATIFIR